MVKRIEGKEKEKNENFANLKKEMKKIWNLSFVKIILVAIKTL